VPQRRDDVAFEPRECRHLEQRREGVDELGDALHPQGELLTKRLRRRPLTPAADSSASRKRALGSATSSTRRTAGRSSRVRPVGWSAARRIAGSSKSNHASVIRTGTTLTRLGRDGISAWRASGGCASASR
jgi:hypothetical protein